MIGSLASFEEAFGLLWGIGTRYEDLTPEQAKFRDLWEETRTAVLNKGNTQLRGAMDELSEYTTEWNRHTTTLIVRK